MAEVAADHTGEHAARADDHQVAVMPGAGVIAHGARCDIRRLTSGAPVIARAGQVGAQRGQRQPGLDDRVGPAQQAAGDLAAQGRVDLPDGGRVEQLEAAPDGVGPGGCFFQHAELGLVGSHGERARSPEMQARHGGAQLGPQLAGAQRQGEFPAGPPAADPDQAEVPDARAPGLAFALQVHDLVTAAPGRHRVHRAEHAPADHHDPLRDPHACQYSQFPNMYSQLFGQRNASRGWRSLLNRVYGTVLELQADGHLRRGRQR